MDLEGGEEDASGRDARATFWPAAGGAKANIYEFTGCSPFTNCRSFIKSSLTSHELAFSNGSSVVFNNGPNTNLDPAVDPSAATNSFSCTSSGNIDAIKYDRQIRLFGFQVQEAISAMHVQVLGHGNLAVAEVIKNTTLLGIRRLTLQKPALEDVRKLVPNELCEINEALQIEFSDEIVACDFLFVVDSTVTHLRRTEQRVLENQ